MEMIFKTISIPLFALQCTICSIQNTEVHKTKCYEHRRTLCANAYVLKKFHTLPQAAAGLVAARAAPQGLPG
jgi:hypothetical protein